MGVILEVLDLRTLGLQFLRGVEGYISLARIEQLLDILLIDITALALAVRAFVATKRDTLIKLDAQPTERLNDILLGSRHKTVGVGVFNAENQVAAMLLGKKIIIQCGAYATNMQSPRRTRGKTNSYSSF